MSVNLSVRDGTREPGVRGHAQTAAAALFVILRFTAFVSRSAQTEGEAEVALVTLFPFLSIISFLLHIVHNHFSHPLLCLSFLLPVVPLSLQVTLSLCHRPPPPFLLFLLCVKEGGRGRGDQRGDERSSPAGPILN